MARRKRKGRKGGTRKLHGAALAAHNKKMRRGGSKKSRKRTHKRAAGSRSLEGRVTALEHFAHKQKKLNTVFRDSIRHIYAHEGIGAPRAMRRLPSGR